MRVLLDTCVLSELRKPRPNRSLEAAIDEIPSSNLFVSVITIGEIVKGISLLRESKRKRSLQTWLQQLERYYSERIIAIDMDVSRIWGELTAAAQKRGKVISASDGLIAATARRYGLHLMTRNTRDFEETGVMLINPWQEK